MSILACSIASRIMHAALPWPSVKTCTADALRSPCRKVAFVLAHDVHLSLASNDQQDCNKGQVYTHVAIGYLHRLSAQRCSTTNLQALFICYSYHYIMYTVMLLLLLLLICHACPCKCLNPLHGGPLSGVVIDKPEPGGCNQPERNGEPQHDGNEYG